MDYFQTGDKYTLAYIKGKKHLLRSSLKKLESLLDPDQFWRIHRGTMLRVKAIELITKMLSEQLFINIGAYKLSVRARLVRRYFDRIKGVVLSR